MLWPSPPPDRVLTVDDFVSLEDNIPDRLNPRNRAQFDLCVVDMDGSGEGNIYAVFGYLYFGRAGRQSSTVN